MKSIKYTELMRLNQLIEEHNDWKKKMNHIEKVLYNKKNWRCRVDITIDNDMPTDHLDNVQDYRLSILESDITRDVLETLYKNFEIKIKDIYSKIKEFQEKYDIIVEIDMEKED